VAIHFVTRFGSTGHYKLLNERAALR